MSPTPRKSTTRKSSATGGAGPRTAATKSGQAKASATTTAKSTTKKRVAKKNLHPRVRAPQAVRTAVLDASLDLFARKGFAETSLRDISRQSAVSHSLMLHHFGSKEALYSEVKRRVVEGYAERFPTAARAVNRPINFRVEMKRIMTYVGENELALKLCARTRIEDDHQVWPGEPDLFNLIQQRIEVAQRQQRIRDDLDARQLCVMILGMVFFWLDNRKHFATRFGKPLDDDRYLDTAVRMIEDGLRPRTASSAKD